MPAPMTMISIPTGYSASASLASGPVSPPGFEDSHFWDRRDTRSLMFSRLAISVDDDRRFPITEVMPYRSSDVRCGDESCGHS